MGTYLVTGGNKGIGLEIVKALRERGDSVYTCQRTEPDDFQDHWLGIDFLEESDLMNIIRYFMMMPGTDPEVPHVMLDGIIIGAVDREPDGTDVAFAFKCRDSFTVNVLSPMCMVKFLSRFDIIKPGAAVIFLDREEALTNTNSQYMLGKAAIPEAVHILDSSYPDMRVKHVTHSAAFNMTKFIDRVLRDLVEVSSA